MSEGLTPAVLIAKACRACESARLLLAAGDIDGACNRAYYAMFDAARAALFGGPAAIPPETVKTHSGLIAAFGLNLVKPGLVPLALGRAINWAEDLRLMADYRGDAIEPGDARELVEQAEAFVADIQRIFPALRDTHEPI
ncbi:HEPN domain-containing protein [Rehaibacterium terrae]|uniref:Uncharacterized protein (UPF0332 family) n=1 Tax=Rehaibacterium terrae TaxID=1341696 RepID=A0A7W7V912_9GAMM|nr:uncharacterized protein (UPF0332 family) [Rehaibacterium terrae]